MTKSPDHTTLVTAANSLRLLDCFTMEEPELSVAELSERINLAKSIISRMVATFLAEGLLEKNADTGKYKLSLGILELGAVALMYGTNKGNLPNGKSDSEERSQC